MALIAQKTLPEAGGCAGRTLYLPADRQGGDSGLFGKDERDGRQTTDRHPAWEIDHDHHHHKKRELFG